MTQGLKKVWVLLLLVEGVGPFAFAGDRLPAAETKLADAQNRYFEGLVSGKASTPDAERRLKDQTVNSAWNEVQRVMREDNASFVNQHLELMSPARFQQELEAAQRADANWSQKDKKINGIEDFAQNFLGYDGGPPPLAGGQVIDSYQRGSGRTPSSGSSKPGVVPGVVIDGRNVPKVIEFPVKKK